MKIHFKLLLSLRTTTFSSTYPVFCHSSSPVLLPVNNLRLPTSGCFFRNRVRECRCVPSFWHYVSIDSDIVRILAHSDSTFTGGKKAVHFPRLPLLCYVVLLAGNGWPLHGVYVACTGLMHFHTFGTSLIIVAKESKLGVDRQHVPLYRAVRRVFTITDAELSMSVSFATTIQVEGMIVYRFYFSRYHRPPTDPDQTVMD